MTDITTITTITTDDLARALERGDVQQFWTC
jgi:hypothetical protein